MNANLIAPDAEFVNLRLMWINRDVDVENVGRMEALAMIDACIKTAGFVGYMMFGL